MSEGNGNGNNGSSRPPNPWGPEEPTPAEPPVLAEHADIFSQLHMLTQATVAEAAELKSITQAIRVARTPIGPGILLDIATALEVRLEGAHETIAMLREQAAKMQEASTK